MGETSCSNGRTRNNRTTVLHAGNGAANFSGKRAQSGCATAFRGGFPEHLGGGRNLRLPRRHQRPCLFLAERRAEPNKVRFVQRQCPLREVPAAGWALGDRARQSGSL